MTLSDYFVAGLKPPTIMLLNVKFGGTQLSLHTTEQGRTFSHNSAIEYMYIS